MLSAGRVKFTNKFSAIGSLFISVRQLDQVNKIMSLQPNFMNTVFVIMIPKFHLFTTVKQTYMFTLTTGKLLQ